MTVQPLSGSTARQHPDPRGLVHACIVEAWTIARRQLDEEQAGLLCTVVALRLGEVQLAMGTEVRSWVTEVVDVEVARFNGTVRWRDEATPHS